MNWIKILSEEDQNDLLRAGHAGMLHDSHRHRAYQQAITSAINDVHSSGSEVYLLDIGVGTGLLTIFAAQAGAEKIVACESFAPMARLSNKVIQCNQSSFPDTNIIIEYCCSTKLDTKYHNKFNIIISEVYDSELIGEGCLLTYEHALTQLAASDCIFIPQKAEIYAQPLYSKCLEQCRSLLDSECFSVPKNHMECPGFIIPWEIHVDKFPSETVRLGSDLKIWDFDFSLNGIKSWIGKKKIEVMEPCIGYVLWWRSKLYKNNFICTAPSQHRWFEEFRDHWMPMIHFIPKGITTVMFSVTSYTITLSTCDKCVCDLHTMSLPRQFGMMNCEQLKKMYCYQCQRNDNVLAYSGGKSLLPIIVAKMFHKVVKVEKGFMEDPFMRTLTEHNDVSDLLLQGDVEEEDIVIVDCYDATCLTNYEFYVKWLGRKVYCHRTIPSNVNLAMFVIESEQIHKRTFPPRFIPSLTLTDIDISSYHSVVLELFKGLMFDDKLDPVFLWEFDHTVLSKKVLIDQNDIEELKRGEIMIPIIRNGTVHAVCFSLIIDFDGEMFEDEEYFTKTDILCLSEGVNVKKSNYFQYNATL